MIMGKPKIRFRGFNDDWEQRKLGEIVDIYDGVHQTPDYQDSGIMFLSVENISTLRSNKYISLEAFERDYKVYPEKGDILMTRIGDIGTTNVVENTEKVAFYVSLALLKAKTTNPYFLSNAMKNEVFQKELRQRSLLTAIPQKINKDEIGKTDISITVNPEEQEKIGEYFKNIDYLITLHQWKCYFYEIIRLNDWEQRKFSDFTWKAGKRNKEDLDLEPYAITNEHGFIRQCDAHDDFGYMKDTDRKAYNIVQPNSFAYNPARINVGSIGYYKGSENVIVSSLYEVFQTDDYVDDRFLWHWFKSDEFPRWIERLQEGSVRLYFYYDKLSECQLPMPSLEEQKKVAVFLDSIDHLITLHQRKYILYKNIKSDTEKQRKLCESEEKPKAKTLILA